MDFSRRDFGKYFLGSIPVATAMLSAKNLLAATGAGAQAHAPYPPLLDRRGAGCLNGDFNSTFAGVQIGTIAWYGYRQMPNITIPALLNYMIENGISGCELECGEVEPFAGAPAGAGPFGGFGSRNHATQRPTKHLTRAQRAAAQKEQLEALNKWRMSVSMKKFEQIRKMYNAQGVQIYGFKLEPAESWFPDGVLEYCFQVCEALGANQLTMELPGTYTGKVTSSGRHVFNPDNAFTKRIGSIAAKYKIMVGYHEHLDASPTLWNTALSQSPYNGINIDVGHYVAAGNHDVVEFIRQHHSRITSLHLKDCHYPNIDHGSNEVWGQGDTPLKEILLLMRDNRYMFPGTIELEYKIPKNSNPVIETGRCLAWAKNVLLANGPEIAKTA